MRNPTIYKIFVAGPADVAAEIEIARDLLADISTLTAGIGIQFESFFWAEDATPGLSSEPQARINTQSAGYDAFLAILGSKIGYPTANYDSGTVEEIENAIKSAPDSIFSQDSVLIYFKEINFTSKSPNLENIIKVQNFRKSLGERGILFKDFSDISDFRQSILKSFSRILKIHIENSPKNSLPNDLNIRQLEIAPPVENLESDSQLGIIDLDQLISDKMQSAISRVALINDAIINFGDQITTITLEISNPIIQIDQSKAKHILIKASVEMDNCSEILEYNIPELFEDFQDAMSDAKNLLELRAIDFPEVGGNSENVEFVSSISTSILVMKTSITTFENFQLNIQKLPRLIRELNISKNRLLKATGKIISMFESMEQKCEDVITFYKGIETRLASEK